MVVMTFVSKPTEMTRFLRDETAFLFVEDDAGQVEEHLVPLHLQLAALVELRIAEADAAELQVLLEDGLVVAVEDVAAGVRPTVALVDDLGDADDLAVVVADGHADERAGGGVPDE